MNSLGDNVGMSIFQGSNNINIDPNTGLPEEEEALEDQRRRNEELESILRKEFDDLDMEDDDDNGSSLCSSTHLSSAAHGDDEGADVSSNEFENAVGDLGLFSQYKHKKGAHLQRQVAHPPNLRTPYSTQDFSSPSNFGQTLNGDAYSTPYTTEAYRNHVNAAQMPYAGQQPESTMSIMHYDHCYQSSPGLQGAGDAPNLLSVDEANELYRQTGFNSMEQLQVLYEVRMREIKRLSDQLQQEQQEKEKLKRELTVMEAEKERAKILHKQSQELLVDSKDKITELQKENDSLKLDISKLEKSKLELLNELELSHNSISELQNKIQMLEKGNRTNEKHIDIVLKEVHEKHGKEMKRIQDRLNETSVILDKRERRIEDLEHLVRELKQKNDSLILEKVDANNQLAARLEESQKQCQALMIAANNKEHVKLGIQLEAQENENSKLRSRIEELTRELTSVQEDLKHFEGIEKWNLFSSPANGKVSTPMSLNGSTDLNGKLRDEFHRSLQGLQKKRDEISKLKEEVHQKECALHTMKQEQQKLLQEVDSYKEENNKLVKQVNNFKELAQHWEAVESKIAKQNEMLEDSKAQRVDLEIIIQELRAEIDYLKKTLNKVEQEKVQAKPSDMSEEYLRFHEQAVARVRKECQTEAEMHSNDLRVKLEQEQKENMHIKQLYIEVCENKEQLVHRVNALQQEKEKLVQRTEQDAKALTELKCQLAKTSEELDKERNSLKQLRESYARIVNNEVERAKQQVLNEFQELKNLQTGCDKDLASEANLMKEENSKLKAEIENNAKELKKLENLSSKVQSLENKLQDSNYRMKSLENENEQLQAYLKKLEVAKVILGEHMMNESKLQSLKEAAGRCDALSRELDEAMSENCRSTQKLEMLQNEILQLEGRQKVNVNEEILNENSKLKNKIHEYEEKFEEFEKEIYRRTEEVEKSKKEVKSLVNETEQLRMEVKRCKSKLIEMTRIVKEVEEQKALKDQDSCNEREKYTKFLLEMNNVKAELESEKDKNYKITQKNEVLKAELNDKNLALESLKREAKKSEDLNKDIESLKSDLKGNKAKIKLLEIERQQLLENNKNEHSKENMEYQKNPEEKVNKLLEELSSQQTENKELKKRISELEDLLHEAQNTRQVWEDLEKQSREKIHQLREKVLEMETYQKKQEMVSRSLNTTPVEHQLEDTERKELIASFNKKFNELQLKHRQELAILENHIKDETANCFAEKMCIMQENFREKMLMAEQDFTTNMAVLRSLVEQKNQELESLKVTMNDGNWVERIEQLQAALEGKQVEVDRLKKLVENDSKSLQLENFQAIVNKKQQEIDELKALLGKDNFKECNLIVSDGNSYVELDDGQSLKDIKEFLHTKQLEIEKLRRILSEKEPGNNADALKILLNSKEREVYTLQKVLDYDIKIRKCELIIKRKDNEIEMLNLQLSSLYQELRGMLKIDLDQVISQISLNQVNTGNLKLFLESLKRDLQKYLLEKFEKLIFNSRSITSKIQPMLGSEKCCQKTENKIESIWNSRMKIILQEKQKLEESVWQLQSDLNKTEANLQELRTKYKSVKKCLKSYKEWSAAKDDHINKELNRVEDGYRNAIIQLQNKIDSILSSKVAKHENQAVKNRLQ